MTAKKGMAAAAAAAAAQTDLPLRYHTPLLPPLFLSYMCVCVFVCVCVCVYIHVSAHY